MIETEMHKRLQERLIEYPVTLTKIETGAVTLGVPDVFYYHYAPSAFSGWMEYKHVPTFDTKVIKPVWRPGQLARGREFVRAEVRLWLCLLADDTEDVVFLGGQDWKQEYTSDGLASRSIVCAANIHSLSGQLLVNILGAYQYE